MDESQPDIRFFNAQPSNTSKRSSEEAKEELIPRKQAPKFIPSDLYYDMSGDKFVIIFNHYEYKNSIYFNYKRPSTRSGTHKDVLSVKRTFGDLGFKVITYTDLEHAQILEKLRDVSIQDHTKTSCLVVVILTHGDKGGELYAADRPYTLKDLTTKLENGHVSLVTKPKLFFIQACRGDQLDAGRTVQYDGEHTNTMLVPSHVDFLIMQSSVEDYISWREGDGSWLIQELCENIQKHHHEMDILQLVTLTTKNVAYKRISNTAKTKTSLKKQTPETRFTLTKFLKL